jgi:hypothetical protein
MCLRFKAQTREGSREVFIITPLLLEGEGGKDNFVTFIFAKQASVLCLAFMTQV